MRKTFGLAVLLLSLWAIAAHAEDAVPSKDAKVADKDRIENWTGKTVMVFTPHPDDDTFMCGGIMELLARNKNKVVIVIYTNDNKGSQDLEMTRERLARIRRAEEKAACQVLGIPKEDLIWLGYEDGDLEYAAPQRLRGEACRLIKKYRPDAVFTVDPGDEFERWRRTVLGDGQLWSHPVVLHRVAGAPAMASRLLAVLSQGKAFCGNHYKPGGR